MSPEEFLALDRSDAYELFMTFYTQVCLATSPAVKATSANSSLAPSQDPFKTKKVNNSRVITGRKPGGQIGHSGTTLLATDKPDFIIPLMPEACPCGCQFTDADPIISIQSNQVVDLPEMPSFQVTQYDAATKRCRHCQARVQAEFPPNAKAHVQYGFELKNLVVYLRIYQLIPNLRTTELIDNLYGLKISVGTVDTILSQAGKNAEETLAKIKQALLRAGVVHFDESGMKIKGEKGWIHVATTNLFTLYFHHASRGRDAIDEGGILPGFDGIAIHDFYSAYAWYSCQHGYCGAHLLRECQGVVDADNYAWAKKLKACLSKMNRAVIAAKAKGLDSLPEELVAEFEASYLAILAAGDAEMPPPPERQPGQRGRLKLGKARSLFNRFTEYQPDILRFLRDFKVPFTNNCAEQAVRMPKMMQKISGSTRSDHGAKRFCGIRSIISTLRKQGRDIWFGLGDLIRGKPVDVSLPVPAPASGG